ncbi:MAG: hypothetical protein ABI193_18710 [Minicystis sp.]
MSVRLASSSLQRVQIVPPLIERAPLAAAQDPGALAWQGEVRLAADRASGIGAARWQRQVRNGLLERAMVLGADHRRGPHGERPEVGRRLLAHIDALAEAGLSFAEIEAFAGEAELDHPGALWVLSILFGCLDDSTAEEAFEAWVDSLDASLFLDYRAVEEIAEALRILPNPALRQGALRWAGGPSSVLRAVALEALSLDQVSDDLLLRLSGDERPLVRAALERLFARTPRDAPRREPTRGSWIDIAAPALSYEVARARLLQRDSEPLFRLRRRESTALAALGPHALDLLALAGDGRDGALAADLVRALPGTPHLLSTMGRVGFSSLLPRLLAELDNDDLEDEAHEALSTMLGPRVSRPSRGAWEQVILALPEASRTARLRGGEAYTPASVLEEMKRPELSEQDLRLRADEVLIVTGKQASPAWGAFGISLEGALSELFRLAR